MKKVAVLLVFTLIMALSATAVLALTNEQKEELTSLYEQQHQLRIQIMEKKVEAGLIDAENAEAVRERMEESWERRQEKMAEGEFGRGKRIQNREFKRHGDCH